MSQHLLTNQSYNIDFKFNANIHNYFMQIDNKTIKERLAEFLTYKGIGQDKFAQLANLSRGFANNVGDSIRQSSLDKIRGAFPELNTLWLTSGVGNMLNTDAEQNLMENQKEIEGDSKKDQYNIISNTASNEELIENVTYLLPMSAMGGSLNGFAPQGALLQDCEKIISPIKGVDFAITVYGDSMAPEYPSGSRVLIKKINPGIFIDWGKVYVLDTPNGVIIKEIHECKEKEGHIKCHSINPDPKYADFDVALSEIYGMYRVLMCLSAK